MKGISFGVIFALIIGILVILLLSPALFKTVSGVIITLEEQIGLVKYSPIEQQIICYYYLCKYGCGSGQYEDWCGPTGKYNIEKVHDEICVLPDKLKVAGEQCKNSIGQFPIRIELDNDNELFKDRLKKRIDTSELFIATENTKGGVNWLDLFNPFASISTIGKLVGGVSVTVLSVKESFLTDKDYETFKIGAGYIENLIKFAKVRKGSYYIYGASSGNNYNLVINDKAGYISITSYGVVSLEVKPSRIIRLSIEDEKEKDSDKLENYNYLLRITAEPFVQPPFDNTPSLNLEFWNTTNKQKSEYKCKKIDCSEWHEFTFNTRNGVVKVSVTGVEIEQLPLYFGFVEYNVNKININIGYTYQECPSGTTCLDVNICKLKGRCEPGYSCRSGCCCRIG
jgi:hypothetical protein